MTYDKLVEKRNDSAELMQAVQWVLLILCGVVGLADYFIFSFGNVTRFVVYMLFIVAFVAAGAIKKYQRLAIRMDKEDKIEELLGEFGSLLLNDTMYLRELDQDTEEEFLGQLSAMYESANAGPEVGRFHGPDGSVTTVTKVDKTLGETAKAATQ